MRNQTLSFLASCLLAAPCSVLAIGDITCETPDVAGVPSLVPVSSDPRDDVVLTKVEEADQIGVAKVAEPAGDGSLDLCVVGPLPPLNGLQGAGSDAPTQAYIEHGLAADASWQGFRFDLALPEAGLPEGTDIVMLALDFDTAAGAGEQFRVALQRRGTGAALLLFRAGEPASSGVALAVGSGPVSAHWASGALTLSQGGESVAAALAPGSRARAVRAGYLGVNAPDGALGEVYLVDPAFVAE
jgi:hypothetical protein